MDSSVALTNAVRAKLEEGNMRAAIQIISSEDGRVVAAASTLEKDLKAGLKSTSNKEAAAAVGKAIAEKAVEAGIKEVAFDRSGYRYHGRVKELADAAREVGLSF